MTLATRSRVVGVFLALAGMLAMVLLWSACPKAGTDPAATTATAAPSPPWWMSVADGKVHRGLDEAPIGIYAAGTREGERFVPGGDLEGSGTFGAEGHKGWLELGTGRFIAEENARPAPPYVEGSMTPSGFSPASRKVRY